MLPSLNPLIIVMSINLDLYCLLLTLLVVIPIVLLFQLNGEGDVLVRIPHQTLLTKHSLSVVEDDHGSPSLLIVHSQVLHLTLIQHALHNLKLLTSVSLQNVVEGVHESPSLLTVNAALPVPHLKVP